MAERAAQGIVPGKGGWKDWLINETLYQLTPTGVLIFGGSVAAFFAWWLIERVKQPPHEVVLMKQELKQG